MDTEPNVCVSDSVRFIRCDLRVSFRSCTRYYSLRASFNKQYIFFSLLSRLLLLFLRLLSISLHSLTFLCTASVHSFVCSCLDCMSLTTFHVLRYFIFFLLAITHVFDNFICLNVIVCKIVKLKSWVYAFLHVHLYVCFSDNVCVCACFNPGVCHFFFSCYIHVNVKFCTIARWRRAMACCLFPKPLPLIRLILNGALSLLSPLPQPLIFILANWKSSVDFIFIFFFCILTVYKFMSFGTDDIFAPFLLLMLSVHTWV